MHQISIVKKRIRQLLSPKAYSFKIWSVSHRLATQDKFPKLQKGLFIGLVVGSAVRGKNPKQPNLIPQAHTDIVSSHKHHSATLSSQLRAHMLQ